MLKTGKESKEKGTTDSGKYGWALALEKAQSRLYRNRIERSRLMIAIRLFQDKIKNGDPWPTEQGSSTEQDGLMR